MDNESIKTQTFDQWIDAVNARVRACAERPVRTLELGFDGAWWRGHSGHVTVALADDGLTANVSADGGVRFTVPFRSPEGHASLVGDRIAHELDRPKLVLA